MLSTDGIVPVGQHRRDVAVGRDGEVLPRRRDHQAPVDREAQRPAEGRVVERRAAVVEGDELEADIGLGRHDDVGVLLGELHQHLGIAAEEAEEVELAALQHAERRLGVGHDAHDPARDLGRLEVVGEGFEQDLLVGCPAHDLERAPSRCG